MIQMPDKLTRKELKRILRGACFLASGGGGPYSGGLHLVDHFEKGTYYHNAAAEVIRIEDARDGCALVAAYIGSPERISDIKYPVAAEKAVLRVAELIKQTGKEIKYLLPVEIGAISSIVPCLVASRLGLKVIDADGAGRAVPQLTMLTYASRGISTNPTVLANGRGVFIDLAISDSRGEHTSFEAQRNAASIIESIARPVIGVDVFNEIAGLAIWVIEPRQLEKTVPIRNTLSLSWKVGKKLEEFNVEGNEMVHYLRKKCDIKAYNMFEGYVAEQGTGSFTGGGFDHGQITLVNESIGKKIVLMLQNETLIAWDSGKSKPTALAPDSIAILVDDKQKVYSNADIIADDGKLSPNLKDKKLTLIGIAANNILRNEKEIMSNFTTVLASLGYYGKYIKIEDIWGK